MRSEVQIFPDPPLSRCCRCALASSATAESRVRAHLLQPAKRPRAASFRRRDGGTGSSLGAIAQLGERLLCKQEVGGSIPPGSTISFFGGLAQLGEHLPYKQGVIGSSPIAPTIYAGVAQLVEQLICNQQVGGSNPSTSSKKEA